MLATRDLEAGAVLSEGDVKLADWPGAVPRGDCPPAGRVGRGVVTPIYSKEPVIESRLAPKGGGGGLAAMIPQGMRAFAVRVNEVVGVAGFVTPGMRVDVVINGNRRAATAAGHPRAHPAAEHRSALGRAGLQEGRGRQARRDAGGQPAGNARAGRKLSLAANQTTIQLVLRNPLDRQRPRPRARRWHTFSTRGCEAARGARRRRARARRPPARWP